MALVTIPGGFTFPPLDTLGAATPAFQSAGLIDAANEKFAYIFRAPKTGTIDRLTFRTATVTTGATVDVRLETVDATTGFPTGTLVGTTTNGSLVIASTDDAVWKEVTLTLGASVTKNDLLATVIVNPSSSPGTINLSAWQPQSAFPYCALFTSSWAAVAREPCMLVRYNDATYPAIPGCFSGLMNNTLTFNNGSSPDVRGLKFKLPVPFRVAGCWASVDGDGDFDIKLYDSNGTTVLETVSVDKDVRSGTGASFYLYFFATSRVLLANTFYRLVISPTSATSVGLYEMTYPSQTFHDLQPGGSDFCLTTQVDGGSWTDTVTERPWIGLIIDQLDDGGSTWLRRPTILRR